MNAHDPEHTEREGAAAAQAAAGDSTGTNSSQRTVLHDEANNRFVIQVEGVEAGFAEYTLRDGGVRDFNHTVVDSAFRGQGLSKPLITEALQETRSSGLKILASCSAVAGFVDKNPEYQDLLA